MSHAAKTSPDVTAGDLLLRISDKAQLARSRAKTAKKRGNTRKWDKFNAVARVYEMVHADLMAVAVELPTAMTQASKHTTVDISPKELELLPAACRSLASRLRNTGTVGGPPNAMDIAAGHNIDMLERLAERLELPKPTEGEHQ